MAFVHCGGFVDVVDGLWPLGTHTFLVGTFVCCFGGLVMADFVLGFFIVAGGDFC